MMFKDELKKYVDENPKSVSMKPAGDNIYVLKYKKSVFYNNTWNDFLEHCRGTIVDEDFNLVTYPFQKIYNYGIETRSPVLTDDTMVTAFRKVNGFMVAVTVCDGKLLVSTTGSTASPFVIMARELIDEARYLEVCKRWEGYTFMFECVHKNDPHIIPEREGMYLLGWRENKWNSPVEHEPFALMAFGYTFDCFVPESLTTNMARLQQLVKECRHEGFVAYTNDGQAFKIKSPHYLVSKWVARNPNTDKLMSENFKKQIDEEYYGLLSAIQANIVEYTAKSEQERLAWVREQLS
jgi:hypothetical protein